MSVGEHALRANHGQPIRIWRIVGVRGAARAEVPTGRHIRRNLQVPDSLAGDAGLAVIATAQDGVVHRVQLTGLGFGRGAVAHRVATGRLHRRFAAVYAVGHEAIPLRGQLIAALLQGGEDCVLSHDAAALLWDLLAAGYRVLRISWLQLVATPIAVAVRIGQALAAGGVPVR